MAVCVPVGPRAKASVTDQAAASYSSTSDTAATLYGSARCTTGRWSAFDSRTRLSVEWYEERAASHSCAEGATSGCFVQAVHCGARERPRSCGAGEAEGTKIT